MKSIPCRCGRATDVRHNCHADGFTCPEAGERRTVTTPTGVYETWACALHWGIYLDTIRERTGDE